MLEVCCKIYFSQHRCCSKTVRNDFLLSQFHNENDFLMTTFNKLYFISFLIFTEISKVRASLFQINGVRKEPLELPEPDGQAVTLNEKVYVPVKEHPDVSTRKKNSFTF